MLVLPSPKGPGPSNNEGPRRVPASEEEPECPCTHPGPLATKVYGALWNLTALCGLQQLHSKCLPFPLWIASDLSWGEIGDGSRAWKRRVYKPWIALKMAALGLVCNLYGFFWARTSLLISNVQCLEIERFRNGIRKSLLTKPVFPCGDNWFELWSPCFPGWVCHPQLIMSPTPSLYTHPCTEAQQQVLYVHFSKIQLIGKRDIWHVHVSIKWKNGRWTSKAYRFQEKWENVFIVIIRES